MGRAHGTAGGYAKGCRCDDCREAARLAQRKNRHSWRPTNRQTREEQAWLETEPEYFHARLRETSA
jgi:hypothetical protein